MTDNGKSNRLDAFTIVEKEGMEKKFWTKVGVGFVNRDGSIQVYLDAHPVNGQLHLREPAANGSKSKGARGAAAAEG